MPRAVVCCGRMYARAETPGTPRLPGIKFQFVSKRSHAPDPFAFLLLRFIGNAYRRPLRRLFDADGGRARHMRHGA